MALENGCPSTIYAGIAIPVDLVLSAILSITYEESLQSHLLPMTTDRL